MKKKQTKKTKPPHKVSFSRISTYLQCGRKYELSYEQKIKSIDESSALYFGKVLDQSLNELLVIMDLGKSLEEFNKLFIETPLQYYPNDLDTDLYLEEDIDNLQSLHITLYGHSSDNIVDDIKTINTDDWSKLDSNEKQILHKAYFLSLFRKGHIIIESYNKWVMPKIEEVYEIQNKTIVTNDDGDQLEGTFDLVARVKNEGTYLLDNKSTSYAYEKDSAANSPQLLIYDTIYKGAVKLNGVGFITFNKNIWKKKYKVCTVCDFDNSSSSHRTCNKMINGERCHGSLKVTIDKKCFIDIILAKPNERMREMFLKTVDDVSNLIKKKVYTANWNSCKMGKFKCIYYDYCRTGSMTGLKKEAV